MKLINGASSTGRQIDSPLVEQSKRIVDGLRIDLPGVAVQSCDAGCGRSVDAVVLASSTTGEFTYSGGGGSGNIVHDLTEGKEPQCEVVPEAVGVLDGPASVRPGFGPND
ncbi:hypothetical protein GCM10020255_012480 [Rhodococcus baikonurensis]